MFCNRYDIIIAAAREKIAAEEKKQNEEIGKIYIGCDFRHGYAVFCRLRRI